MPGAFAEPSEVVRALVNLEGPVDEGPLINLVFANNALFTAPTDAKKT